MQQYRPLYYCINLKCVELPVHHVVPLLHDLVVLTVV